MEVTLAIIIHNTDCFISNLLDCLKNINCHQIFLLNGMHHMQSIKQFQDYRKTKSNVRIVKTDRLLRHPIAINMLLKEVKTEYVFIMDSDILTTEKDIQEIYHFIKTNPEYGAVQGLLLYPQTNRIQSSGHIFHEYWDYYGLHNSFLYNLEKPLKRQALSAGFAMYPMEVVRQMKGFSEFHLNQKDGTEFSTRIHLASHQVCCLPTAKGYHFHSLFRREVVNRPPNEIARYWATYGQLLKNDVTQEIRNNNLFKDFSDYIIVDCSPIKDFSAFMDGLQLKNKRIELKVTDLVDKELVLENVVPNILLKSRYKILWLCNNFMQIANNKLLFNRIERQEDFIIDLSANVIPIKLLR